MDPCERPRFCRKVECLMTPGRQMGRGPMVCPHLVGEEQKAPRLRWLRLRRRKGASAIVFCRRGRRWRRRMRALNLHRRFPRLMRVLEERRRTDPLVAALVEMLEQGQSLDRALPHILRRLLVERDVAIQAQLDRAERDGWAHPVSLKGGDHPPDAVEYPAGSGRKVRLTGDLEVDVRAVEKLLDSRMHRGR